MSSPLVTSLVLHIFECNSAKTEVWDRSSVQIRLRHLQEQLQHGTAAGVCRGATYSESVPNWPNVATLQIRPGSLVPIGGANTTNGTCHNSVFCNVGTQKHSRLESALYRIAALHWLLVITCPPINRTHKHAQTVSWSSRPSWWALLW